MMFKTTYFLVITRCYVVKTIYYCNNHIMSLKRHNFLVKITNFLVITTYYIMLLYVIEEDTIYGYYGDQEGTCWFHLVLSWP